VQAIIGITLAITGAQVWAAWFVLAIMCIYISAYAWSWGPLGWLYSSEVQPLETRSAGQSITTLVNLMFSFVIGQVGIFSPDFLSGTAVNLLKFRLRAGAVTLCALN